MPPDGRQNFLRDPALEGFCSRLLGPQSERVEARFVDVHLVRLLVRRGERFVLPLYKLMERLLVLFVNVIPQRFCWVGVLQAGCHILPFEPRNLLCNDGGEAPSVFCERQDFHGKQAGNGRQCEQVCLQSCKSYLDLPERSARLFQECVATPCAHGLRSQATSAFAP